MDGRVWWDVGGGIRGGWVDLASAGSGSVAASMGGMEAWVVWLRYADDSSGGGFG